MGHPWARAAMLESVKRARPLNLTRRRRGHARASAMMPESVTLSQPDKLIPCNRVATVERPMRDSLEVFVTPVKSMATRLEKLWRTRASISPVIFLQPIRVRRSRRLQREKSLKRSSMRSAPWVRKLRRRIKVEYVKV